MLSLPDGVNIQNFPYRATVRMVARYADPDQTDHIIEFVVSGHFKPK